MSTFEDAIANALIADVSTPEDKAQNFGLMGVAFGLGFIVGPALGGIIGAWDLRAPFFIAVGLAFTNTLYGLLFFRETLAPKNRRPFDLRRASPWGSLSQLRKYPLLIGLILAVFLNNIGQHIWPANWNFYTIEKFAWTPIDVGLSMAFVGVMSVAVQGGLLRIVIPKFGPVRCAYLGIVATIAAFAGVAAFAAAGAVGGTALPDGPPGLRREPRPRRLLSRGASGLGLAALTSLCFGHHENLILPVRMAPHPDLKPLMY